MDKADSLAEVHFSRWTPSGCRTFNSQSLREPRAIKNKKNINDNAMEILEQVAMLTPENIHLNSFMFEPILDMSLLHLYDLYQEVKNLLIKNAVITP